ncbi:MAG: hypothetical protein PHW58_04575 [Candidatus Methanofastidiosa archaeon]|nr:hypothetical protein [Candidatus Methanofastidiosa archaeon]MDD4281488.1 hypothetical protein [Candidatus Methanofastidiosa archaeon]
MEDDLFKELGTLKKSHQELRETCEAFKIEIDDNIKKRDENNTLFKELLGQLKEAKEERDAANEKVSEYKALRDEKRKELSILKDEMKAIKKEFTGNSDSSSPNPFQLQKRIDEMEWKLETSVLPLKEENKLITQITTLRKELETTKFSKEIKDKIKTLRDQITALRKEIDQLHEKVVEFSQESAKYHERVTYFSQRASETKKTADKAHQEFLSKKSQLNSIYAQMRETRDQMNKHRGKITEKKAETKAKRIKEKEKETKKIMDQINDQAKDLYDRFIRGEKLSTEEFKILQESNFL